MRKIEERVRKIIEEAGDGGTLRSRQVKALCAVMEKEIDRLERMIQGATGKKDIHF